MTNTIQSDHSMDWIRRYLDAVPDFGEGLIHAVTDLSVLYVETPKCGSTTIKAVLRFAAGEFFSPEDTGSIHASNSSSLLSASQALATPHRYMGPKSQWVFSVVRDPVPRFVSAYLDKIARPSDQRAGRLACLGLDPHSDIKFDRFLAAVVDGDQQTLDTHWRPQAMLLRTDIVPYSFLGRFEDFTSVLTTLESRVGFINAPADSLNQFRHPTASSEFVAEVLTESQRRMLTDLYATDYELWLNCPKFTI